MPSIRFLVKPEVAAIIPEDVKDELSLTMRTAAEMVLKNFLTAEIDVLWIPPAP